MDPTTDPWSITDGFWDTAGRWHPLADEARAALAAAMGADELEQPPDPPGLWFVRPGDTHSLWSPADLELEDGTVLRDAGELPADLPLGYHWLHPSDGWPAVRLVVSPGVCTPPANRQWGWQVQLYAARSRRSWGIGDLADLATLTRATAEAGGGFVLSSPFHASTPTFPQQPSPYYASSRRYRSVLLLAVDQLPGAAELGDELTQVATAAKALNEQRLIDRDEALRAKLVVLERLFARFGGDHDFDRYVAAEGDALRSFARWNAIAERHGPTWTTWPQELRHPASAAVSAFAEAHGDRVRFHEWCQWHVDRQLAAAASAGAGVIGDLAVGFDPSGADAWADQDLLALGCRVGAPPDTFNTAGQDWGLPPYVPWRLRQARYEPFIATLRAAFRHVAGLRIDHVMGLFRLYWLPPGGDARSGGYVRYPAADLLELVALEAARAGAYVVGEDLGTVEEEVELELAQRRFLTSRVVWFTDDPPSTYPEVAFASVSTHDLPTLAAAWTATDAEPVYTERLRRLTALAPKSPPATVAAVTAEALANSPAVCVAMSLDDACGVLEQPNKPGTIDEWPNWRIALPHPLEDVLADPAVESVAAWLHR